MVSTGDLIWRVVCFVAYRRRWGFDSTALQPGSRFSFFTAVFLGCKCGEELNYAYLKSWYIIYNHASVVSGSVVVKLILITLQIKCVDLCRYSLCFGYLMKKYQWCKLAYIFLAVYVTPLWSAIYTTNSRPTSNNV